MIQVPGKDRWWESLAPSFHIPWKEKDKEKNTHLETNYYGKNLGREEVMERKRERKKEKGRKKKAICVNDQMMLK